MTKEKFMDLPVDERASKIWDEGLYLDSVNYYRYKAYLYSLDNFFVEVLCYQGSTHIESIEVANEDTLTKYLNRIDINALYAM